MTFLFVIWIVFFLSLVPSEASFYKKKTEKFNKHSFITHYYFIHVFCFFFFRCTNRTCNIISVYLWKPKCKQRVYTNARSLLIFYKCVHYPRCFDWIGLLVSPSLPALANCVSLSPVALQCWYNGVHSLQWLGQHCGSRSLDCFLACPLLGGVCSCTEGWTTYYLDSLD